MESSLVVSDGVTLENVLDLLARFRRFSVPLALEVSTVESVTPGFDYYFIPTVLNTTDSKWLNGLHHEALREYGHMMNFDELVTEGYCILNPDCTAAKVTGSTVFPMKKMYKHMHVWLNIYFPCRYFI